MASMSCNLPLRSGWSFIPFVPPFRIAPLYFWAALYHLTLSKSRCALVKKAHSLEKYLSFLASHYRRVRATALRGISERVPGDSSPHADLARDYFYTSEMLDVQ